MRVLVVALFVALVAAGCASQAPATDRAPEGSPAPSQPAAPASPVSNAAEEPTFCASADACTFWDDDYHELALYEVDTANVDVLIVPSASPLTTEDTATMKAAILAWADGIRALGSPWFAEGFTLNVYVLGTDSPPQSALEDPEIVVVAAEYNPVVLFGIGEQLPANVCRSSALQQYPTHAHDGITVKAARCEDGGFTCVAINTNFLLGSAANLYDLVAHEVGHCLGGGHVGDALDFNAKHVPMRDIMSYQHDEAQVHCVSNLNVRVLEALYAPAMGATADTPMNVGDFLTMSPSLYTQVPCGLA